jgi:hypothetical protein
MADALMKAGMTTRDVWHALGFDSALIERIEKYSPDQPRVPAGNGRPSGQWTRDRAENATAPGRSAGSGAGNDRPPEPQSSAGGKAGSSGSHNSTEISVTLHEPSQPDQILSDANPDSIQPGEQYAQIAIGKVPSKGDPRIDGTTSALVDILAAVDTAIPRGVGPLYGIAVHVAFANAVRAANLPGVGTDSVEQSFNLNYVVDYGVDGSIRTDVSLWDDAHENVIAIYDLKTGGAKLSNARAEQLRNGVTLEEGADKPVVFELRIKRN